LFIGLAVLTDRCVSFLPRFDAELSKSQEEVREEKHLREKLQRERDQLASSKITLEQDLQVAKVLKF
jgi:hypothetical protein